MTNTELRAIRYSLGLTQARIARELGISRYYYSRLELGKSRITRTMALAAIEIKRLYEEIEQSKTGHHCD